MRFGQGADEMRIDDLRNRINKLARSHEQTVEPWPPDSSSWIAKLLYDANLEMGIEMPTERPVKDGIIIWLIQAGATRFFDLHPIEDDPLDETRLKSDRN
jgi:hypothetical protein